MIPTPTEAMGGIEGLRDATQAASCEEGRVFVGEIHVQSVESATVSLHPIYGEVREGWAPECPELDWSVWGPEYVSDGELSFYLPDGTSYGCALPLPPEILIDRELCGRGLSAGA